MHNGWDQLKETLDLCVLFNSIVASLCPNARPRSPASASTLTPLCSSITAEFKHLLLKGSDIFFPTRDIGAFLR